MIGFSEKPILSMHRHSTPGIHLRQDA
jgi:hypothetical protein